MAFYSKKRKIMIAPIFALGVLAPVTSQAVILDFHFTGNIMITGQYFNELNPDGVILNNTIDTNGDGVKDTSVPLTPISAMLSYNTVTGVGGSNLSVQMPDFFNAPVLFHDVTLEHDTGSNTISGNILVDWSGNNDMPMHIAWDATGFLNAIDQGLQVGDTISGTTLKKDTTGDGSFDTFIDVLSATPYSDYVLSYNFWDNFTEGPAPLAATFESNGVGYDINGNFLGGTPFDGIHGLINIGSGNSITVTAISAVPVPAAVWLFSSGLIGLIGLTRRKSK